MSRALVIAVVCAAVVLGTRGVAADDGVQVLLVDAPDAEPSPATVQGQVEEQLESYRVWFELVEHEAVPETAVAWTDLARSAGREPGILALVGWRCVSGRDPSRPIQKRLRRWRRCRCRKIYRNL